MEMLYRVHGVSLIKRDDTVTYRGQEIKAPVDCLEVEVEHATQAHAHGSLALRFYGDEIKQAQELFADSYVKLSFACAGNNLAPGADPASEPEVAA